STASNLTAEPSTAEPLMAEPSMAGTSAATRPGMIRPFSSTWNCRAEADAMRPYSDRQPCGQGVRTRAWPRALAALPVALAAAALGFEISAHAEDPKVVRLETVGTSFRATL